MPDHEVIRLSESDAGEILTLQRAAFVEPAIAHQDLALPPLVRTLEQVVQDLRDPATLRLGIRLGGRLVASVRLQFCGQSVELGRLMVAPDLQGRGLGTSLLYAVDRYLPGEALRVDLFTGEHSVASIRLYQRMGYVEVRRESAGAYDLVYMSRHVR